MRGRSRNKGPNPLTRSYESNGPDVKIRGTAQHIADKYSQLARDAQASGDPVASENYLQHAEHYYRLIAAAQEQYRQQFGGFQRDEDGEEGEEEAGGFGGPSMDRGQGGDEFGEVPNFPQGGYEPRGERNQRFDRGDRQGRQRFDRNGERYDRGSGERYDRQGGYERQNGSEARFDRPNGGERYERQDRQDRQERPDRQDRPDRPDRSERQDRPERRERFARDERGGREGYAPREGRPERDGRRESRPVEYEGAPEEQEEAAGLPAFLTNPVRPPASVEEVAESAGLAPPAPPAAEEEPAPTGIRPRRRRTRKTEPAPEGVDETAPGA